MKKNLVTLIPYGCFFLFTCLSMIPQNTSAQILDKLKKKAQQAMEKKNKKTDSTETKNEESGDVSTVSGSEGEGEKKINGTVTVEFNGKIYHTNDNTGAIARGKDGKYSMAFDIRLEDEENHLAWVQVMMNDLKPFKIGTYSLKRSNNIDVSGTGLFNKGKKREPDTGITSGDGVFVITTLQITGMTAKISGTYEFSGPGYEAGKILKVKGSFSNMTIAYLVD